MAAAPMSPLLVDMDEGEDEDMPRTSTDPDVAGD
jgi:hypothetical protein